MTLCPACRGKDDACTDCEGKGSLEINALNLVASLKEQAVLEEGLLDACCMFWTTRKALYAGEDPTHMRIAKFNLYLAMAKLFGTIDTDCDPYRAPELHKDTCSCKLKKVSTPRLIMEEEKL